MDKILAVILAVGIFLRVWQLDTVPVSLFGDEIDIGYHAYSLLKTGKDYSGNFLPLHLQSLADIKSPLYAYSIIPTVAMFGISALGVRLPAAIFGVLGIFLFYLLIKLIFKNKKLALLAALLLTISPWHMHYSRWGFEGTLMLSLYLGGLYFFIRSFTDNKLLIISAVLFGLTPASYHAAKIFLPLMLAFLLVLYFKQIKSISRKYLILSALIFSILITPFTISTFFGGGTDRFQSTSIFNAPAREGNIGSERLRDKNMGVSFYRIFHNKITYFGSRIINNYLQAFSAEFLFLKGDPELTHTLSGYGQFYKFEAIFIILGLIFLYLKINDRSTKLLFTFWLLVAPMPSVLTTGGGYHASRLFFLLPPLVLLTSLGIYYSSQNKFKKIFAGSLAIVLSLSLLFYYHNYWVHYPWDSQKWWHAGFKEAIQSAVLIGQSYDKVIISGADEPPLIFFLGWSQFSPADFHRSYPLKNVDLEGIGEVSQLGKYYFPPIGQERNLYELGKVLPADSLYLATMKEIKFDLIKEPERIPADLTLVKTIPYPSGESAFYLFTKNE